MGMARAIRTIRGQKPMPALSLCDYRGRECPRCGGMSRTVDSRACDMGIRRRRACNACDDRWTTYELAIDNETAFLALMAQIRLGQIHFPVPEHIAVAQAVRRLDRERAKAVLRVIEAVAAVEPTTANAA